MFRLQGKEIYNSQHNDTVDNTYTKALEYPVNPNTEYIVYAKVNFAGSEFYARLRRKKPYLLNILLIALDKMRCESIESETYMW